jgi:hypothetical protein
MKRLILVTNDLRNDYLLNTTLQKYAKKEVTDPADVPNIADLGISTVFIVPVDSFDEFILDLEGRTTFEVRGFKPEGANSNPQVDELIERSLLSMQSVAQEERIFGEPHLFGYPLGGVSKKSDIIHPHANISNGPWALDNETRLNTLTRAYVTLPRDEVNGICSYIAIIPIVDYVNATTTFHLQKITHNETLGEAEHYQYCELDTVPSVPIDNVTPESIVTLKKRQSGENSVLYGAISIFDNYHCAFEVIIDPQDNVLGQWVEVINEDSLFDEDTLTETLINAVDAKIRVQNVVYNATNDLYYYVITGKTSWYGGGTSIFVRHTANHYRTTRNVDAYPDQSINSNHYNVIDFNPDAPINGTKRIAYAGMSEQSTIVLGYQTINADGIPSSATYVEYSMEDGVDAKSANNSLVSVVMVEDRFTIVVPRRFEKNWDLFSFTYGGTVSDPIAEHFQKKSRVGEIIGSCVIIDPVTEDLFLLVQSDISAITPLTIGGEIVDDVDFVPLGTTTEGSEIFATVSDDIISYITRDNQLLEIKVGRRRAEPVLSAIKDNIVGAVFAVSDDPQSDDDWRFVSVGQTVKVSEAFIAQLENLDNRVVEGGDRLYWNIAENRVSTLAKVNCPRIARFITRDIVRVG